MTSDILFFFFFQAEDGIRDKLVTGVQTCALPICRAFARRGGALRGSPEPPRARHRPQADARLRRGGLVRGRGRPGRGDPGGGRVHDSVHRGLARRGGEPDRAARDHELLRAQQRGAARDRHQGQPDSLRGRHRGRRRPDRRPLPGPRPRLHLRLTRLPARGHCPRPPARGIPPQPLRSPPPSSTPRPQCPIPVQCEEETRMKRFILFAAALVLALPAAPAPVSAQKDTLTVALVSHAPTLDPHMHFERVGILVNINMFDSLLHRSTKLQFEPSLATAWKAISDTTWEFKLRKGVKFHNGATMTAEDVKYSFDRVL